jgi:hypothetical protein
MSKNNLLSLTKPLIECERSLRQQRLDLHEMFALAMTNIPDNETDNFTARKLKPTYLALCELLENIQEVQ